MFFQIGFFVLLALVILMCWVFMRANPMKNEGAGSWTEYYSRDPKVTMKFMEDVFGIKATKFGEPTPCGNDYFSLKAHGQFWPFAGMMDLPQITDRAVDPHTLVYITTKNYDAAHAKMLKLGAKALAHDLYAGGMKFGIYQIPGEIVIGVAQYGVKTKK